MHCIVTQDFATPTLILKVISLGPIQPDPAFIGFRLRLLRGKIYSANLSLNGTSRGGEAEVAASPDIHARLLC